MNQAMASVYQYFYKSIFVGRTALYIALVLIFSAGAGAYAATPYTVEGIKVDVTAKNALEARDQAFAKAQIDAFTLLAKNLLPPEKFASFKTPDPAIIAGMIKDYEITQEKLSSVRYSGVYTFRFKDAPVHRFFNIVGDAPTYASQNIYGTGSAPGNAAGPVLVLPFYQKDNNMLLWSPDNLWLQAWGDTAPASASNVIVPIGDLLDVGDIADNQALTYNRSRLGAMTKRYNAAEAALVVALPDTPQAGAVTVNIYRTDRGSPELVQKIFVSAAGAQSATALLGEAVSRARQAMAGSWKNKPDDTPPTTRGLTQSAPPPASVPDGPGNNFLGSVQFSSLQEWAGLQRNLAHIPGVSRVIIQSLSPREAILEISYAGDVNVLRRALAPYHVTLMGDESATRRPPAPTIPALSTPPTMAQPRQESGYFNNF